MRWAGGTFRQSFLCANITGFFFFTTAAWLKMKMNIRFLARGKIKRKKTKKVRDNVRRDCIRIRLMFYDRRFLIAISAAEHKPQTVRNK